MIIYENLRFYRATVAKSQKEYWINVTSKTMYASSANSRMFGDINGKQTLEQQDNSAIDPYKIVEDDEQSTTTERDPYQIVEDAEQSITSERDPYQIVEDDEQNDNKRNPYQIVEDKKPNDDKRESKLINQIVEDEE